jgi:hypothetical protein
MVQVSLTVIVIVRRMIFPMPQAYIDGGENTTVFSAKILQHFRVWPLVAWLVQ